MAGREGVSPEALTLLVDGVNALVAVLTEQQAKITAARAIDPADHATSSRDYGRGFAEAIRLVREALDGKAP